LNNDLVEHLLTKKRDQILEGCLKIVHNGPFIKRLIDEHTLESLRDGYKLKLHEKLKTRNQSDLEFHLMVPLD